MGVGVPPPSGVTTSPVNSTAMRVLLPLPLPPPRGLPLTRLPPLHLRIWVLQRILFFLPFLTVSRVLYLTLLTPRLLCWPIVGASLFYRWIVAWLPSSHPNTQYLWCCLSVWRLWRFRLPCSGSRSAGYYYYYIPPFPFHASYSFALHLGITVRVALALGASCHALSGGLSRHVGRLEFLSVRLPAGFSSRSSCSFPPPSHGSSMCLAHQAQVSASHTAFLVFVTARSSCLASRLLFMVSKWPMLFSPAVLGDSLFLVGVVIVSSRRLGLHLPSGRTSTWLLWFLRVHPPLPPFLGTSVALLAPLFRVAVHRPLLPLALLSGCGFTLPLPLRPCCLLAHRMAGFGVVSLAWLFFLSSVL